MKFCQYRLKIPKGCDWAIRGEFDEAHCCGKPAPCCLVWEDSNYYLCAEHFDQVDKILKQDKFAGFVGDDSVDRFPCGSND